jgi:hypothetical protein
MGAEVVRTPVAEIDPVVYGNYMSAQGDQAAGIGAAAGYLTGLLTKDQLVKSYTLGGQAAFAGAVGIGKDSSASVDYIEARTDGHETAALEVNAKARGGEAAIVAAGAGNFKLQKAFGFEPYGEFGSNHFGPMMAFDRNDLDLQGAVIGAAGIGDNSKAKAGYLSAITDSSRTLAIGYDLKARSDGLALVGAAAGSIGYSADDYYYRSRHDSLWEEYRDLGVQGALAAALAVGDRSSASADFMGAVTNDDITAAFADDPRARGGSMAAILDAAGSLDAACYEYKEHSRHDHSYGSGGYLDVQGALAAALGIGDCSRVSADYMGAVTNGDSTEAFVADPRASGGSIAAALAAAGSVDLGSYEYEEHSRHAYTYYGSEFLGVEGALAGALGIGDCSRVSADYMSAATNGGSTEASATDPRASGGSMAAVMAAAGSLDVASYEYEEHGCHDCTYFGLESLGVQGALAGALGIGDHSRASADFMAAGTNDQQAFAFAADPRAWGDYLAAVMAAAGNLQAASNEDDQCSRCHDTHEVYQGLNAQAALAGALGIGDHSHASADFIGAVTNGDSTGAFVADPRARGDDLAAVLAAAGSLDWHRQIYDRNSCHGYTYDRSSLGIQGALAGALGIGDHSSASADFIAAETNGQQTFAVADDPKARGGSMAAALAAAGYLSAENWVHNSNNDYHTNLWAEGALVGALGAGAGSRASACFIGAATSDDPGIGTSDDQSTAVAIGLRAEGGSFAAVGAGAGAIKFDQNPISKDFSYQGSAVGAYSVGPNSHAFADYIRAHTSWDESSAFARHIGSGPNGKVFAGVAHQLIGGVNGVVKPAGSYDLARAKVMSQPPVTILYAEVS